MAILWPEYLADADGELRFAGSRVGPVEVLFFYNERGYSVEMLALEFPGVPLIVLYKFITFYLEHAAEVDAYVAMERTALDRLRDSSPHHSSLEHLRMRSRKGQQVASS